MVEEPKLVKGFTRGFITPAQKKLEIFYIQILEDAFCKATRWSWHNFQANFYEIHFKRGHIYLLWYSQQKGNTKALSKDNMPQMLKKRKFHFAIIGCAKEILKRNVRAHISIRDSSLHILKSTKKEIVNHNSTNKGISLLSTVHPSHSKKEKLFSINIQGLMDNICHDQLETLLWFPTT